jgi:hypothetical protein
MPGPGMRLHRSALFHPKYHSFVPPRRQPFEGAFELPNGNESDLAVPDESELPGKPGLIEPRAPTPSEEATSSGQRSVNRSTGAGERRAVTVRRLVALSRGRSRRGRSCRREPTVGVPHRLPTPTGDVHAGARLGVRVDEAVQTPNLEVVVTEALRLGTGEAGEAAVSSASSRTRPLAPTCRR